MIWCHCCLTAVTVESAVTGDTAAVHCCHWSIICDTGMSLSLEILNPLVVTLLSLPSLKTLLTTCLDSVDWIDGMKVE